MLSYVVAIIYNAIDSELHLTKDNVLLHVLKADKLLYRNTSLHVHVCTNEESILCDAIASPHRQCIRCD